VRVTKPACLEAALDEGGDDPAVIAQALGTMARFGNVSELAAASA